MTRLSTSESEVFDFLDLANKWSDIIGKSLSKVTSPLKIQNKTLFILTAHPAFSQQLSLMEGEVKNKVLQFFPNLSKNFKRIQFQTNPSHFKASDRQKETELNPEKYTKKNKLNKFSPKFRALKNEAEEIFKQIEDPELSASMMSIYIQNKMNDN